MSDVLSSLFPRYHQPFILEEEATPMVRVLPFSNMAHCRI
jgi:hypothetical protein